MMKHFTESIWIEGDWYIAQCLEVDIASQGETEDEALSNLRESLELYFDPPSPTNQPHMALPKISIASAASWAGDGFAQKVPHVWDRRRVETSANLPATQRCTGGCVKKWMKGRGGKQIVYK